MSDTLTRSMRTLADWCEGAVRKVSDLLGALSLDDEDEAPASIAVMRAGMKVGPALSSATVLDDSFRQLAFTFAVIALGAKLAAADGPIKQEEFTSFCALFPMPGEEEPKIQRLFFLAYSDPNSYAHYARQLAGLFPGNMQLREQLVIRLCQLAEADGRATLSEKRMLEGIAETLDVEKRVVYATLATPFSSLNPADHYGILGVLASISNDGLKQAYRTRIRELHPDRLRAEGYASEDIAHAEAELMAVNEAYLVIARKRKIK